MRDTFLGRRWWVVVASAAVLSGMVGATMRAGAVAVPGGLLQSGLAPIEQVLAAGAGLWSAGIKDIATVRSLERENAVLRAEVARYRILALRDANLATQNENYRQLLNLKQTAEGRYGGGQGTVAEVIGREPGTWFDTAVLDKGRADGVVVGMIALTPGGLVGRVVSPLTAHTANLMLITNPEFGVGTMVARTHSEGTAVGVLGSTTLTMTFFSPQAVAHVGDAVVTSGIGGTYPSGIPVGTVVAMQPSGAGLVQAADVRPAVDISSLGAVLLLPAVGGG